MNDWQALPTQKESGLSRTDYRAAQETALEKLPQHAGMGAWLASQGRGPAEDPLGTGSGYWTTWDPAKDPSKAEAEQQASDFAATAAAAKATADQAEADQLAADQAVLERWDSATAAEKWAVMGRHLQRHGL